MRLGGGRELIALVGHGQRRLRGVQSFFRPSSAPRDSARAHDGQTGKGVEMSSDEARNVTDPTRGRGAGRGESDATDPTRGFSADDPSRLPPDPTAPAGEA